MIKSLHLKNFKCFHDNQIDMAPLTILVGGNASGKSTVVQSLLLSRLSVETIFLNNNSNKVKSPFDLRINGPYMLQLGKASNVLSNNAISDDIAITLIDERNYITRFTFKQDWAFASHLLKGELSSLSEDEVKFIILQGNFSYLNAERYGPRKLLEMGFTTDLSVGMQGEFVSYVIFQADSRRIEVNDDLKIEKDSSRFSHQVQAWVNFIFPSMQLGYKIFDDISMVALEYKNGNLDTNFFPAPNTGFGISYVLPIIVEGLILSTKKGSTFIIENPEAHLHPLGQSRIGRFLALLSLCGVQVIIETHSEHVVNGARLQIALSKNINDLKINYFVQREKNIDIIPLIVNKFGEISDWPPGFLDQEQNDLKDLLSLKREMRKRES